MGGESLDERAWAAVRPAMPPPMMAIRCTGRALEGDVDGAAAVAAAARDVEERKGGGLEGERVEWLTRSLLLLRPRMDLELEWTGMARGTGKGKVKLDDDSTSDSSNSQRIDGATFAVAFGR